jgi:pilus assembly protein CpaF
MVSSAGQHLSNARNMTWEETQQLKLWLANKIGESLDPKVPRKRSPELLQLIRERFTQLCGRVNMNLRDAEREQLYQGVVDELVGYGPIERLLADDTITEVMVNGPSQVYIERDGKISLTDVRFLNDDHVLLVINRIIRPLGRRIDRKWPMVDARLPDGSRVNAIIRPCAVDAPSVTIRKFAKRRFTVADLVALGSMTEEMAGFLEACVVSRLNIVVSGGTGSGKTTLLNVLSSFIPDEERIVTIEDAAELRLSQTHVVRLETKPPEPGDTQRVTIRDLVINSLRMRPDRIIVGECRGGEALDMLQAMNTGHDGSLTTIHANSPRDMLSRLETLVLMAGMDLPLSVVRRQVVSAIDLVVQQARLRDGTRKIVAITEVERMEGETPVMQDIFVFEDQGQQDGKVIGRLKPTGIRPTFTERLIARGFDLPASMFMDKVQQAERSPRFRR